MPGNVVGAYPPEVCGKVGSEPRSSRWVSINRELLTVEWETGKRKRTWRYTSTSTTAKTILLRPAIAIVHVYRSHSLSDFLDSAWNRGILGSSALLWIIGFYIFLDLLA